MEFTANCIIREESGNIILEPLTPEERALFFKSIGCKKNIYVVNCKSPRKDKTYKQIKTVWKLIGIIFESQEGRKPTSEELNNMYEDLLEEYAMKRKSALTGKLIPVHVSRADSSQMAYFVEGLMLHLSQYCDLPMDAQTEVRALLFEWEYFRGMNDDPEKIQCTEEIYRERHPFSEASGRGGALHLHHIVTKGSHEELRHITANWVMLTWDEHKEIHEIGDEAFLEKYPHLRPKFEKAKSLRRKIYTN